MQRIAITHRDGVQAVHFNANKSEVGHRVAAHDGGGEVAIVVERNFQSFSTFDYVVVRHDVAVGRDDYTRAEAHLALALLRLLRLLLWLAEEVLEERVVEETVAAVGLLAHGRITLHRHHTIDSGLGRVDKVLLRKSAGRNLSRCAA